MFRNKYKCMHEGRKERQQQQQKTTITAANLYQERANFISGNKKEKKKNWERIMRQISQDAQNHYTQ